MRFYWIYINIVFTFYLDWSFGKDIFININKDKLPTNTTNIKIFNGDINVTNCPYLRNTNERIYLNLNDNVTSIICITNSNITFYVFTYHTNITSSMVIVENKPETQETIKSISKKIQKPIIILSIQKDYVIFVVCQNEFTNCQYRSVDQREIINNNNLTIYSVCNGSIESGSCISEREFLSDLIDVDNNSDILGHRINIIKSNMEPKYENVPNCLNGGVLGKDDETQRFICICPKTTSFYESGPRCESLKQVIKEKQYLYVLPNTKKISIEFSLFSPAHNGFIEIFNILSRDGLFLNYTINDVVHSLTVYNESLIIKEGLDKKLLHILIEISNETAKFRVNNKEIVEKLWNSNTLMLDTFPFVISGSGKDPGIKICFGNLKINQQIIDLYTPNYTSCVSDLCLLCKSNETCLYQPFKSSAFKECICKSGFVKISDKDICVKNDSMTGQINTGNSLSISTSPNDIKMKFFNLKFRTILSNGNIVTISTIPYTFSIRISKKLINAIIFNEKINKTKIIPINYYNVADGYWHAIYFEYTPHLCKITLDERIPFNSNFTFLDNEFGNNPVNELSVNSVSFGPLIDENSKNSSIITCFDTLTISTEDLQTIKNINLNGTMPGGCDKGSNCSTVSCNKNQKCVEKWQNNTCVCEDAFTDINGTCTFTKCIPNPCEHNGICYPDTEFKMYKCECKKGYNGKNCENSISTAGLSWWIILIIVLLILIILIIILLILCRRKTSKPDKRREKANINEIHENLVSYNDGAGETDYKGPPINFELLNHCNTSNNTSLKEKERPIDPENFDSVKEDLMARKQFFDNHNNDLILDHPLTYMFEGFDSDLESVSSLESINDFQPVNVLPLPRKSSQSKYLNNLKNKM